MSTYDTNNVFAKILRGEMPAYKVAEDDASFAFMDIMPRSDGHVLVIPKGPYRNIFDITPEAYAAMGPMVQRVSVAARKAMGADGVTILQANEMAGGQVVYHLHVHVMPRWSGVALQRPGIMGDQKILAANAEKIRTALG